MHYGEKEKVMMLGIEDKIKLSEQIIKDALSRFDHNKIAISWTGGKDSTLMVWLFRNTCTQLSIHLPRCMFIDEGDVFEEIRDHVGHLTELWKLDLAVVKNKDVISKAQGLGNPIKVEDLNERNRQEILAIGFEGREFPFDPESYVGNHLMKTVPMKMFIEENRIEALATAIRWDEQAARKDEDYVSPRKNPDHNRIHPILHFRERDVWQAIHKFQIPHCSLYNLGYRSLGAKHSTHKTSDIPAWEQDMENAPERSGRGQDKEMIMSKLRDLGYM
ncbi:MAG: phosphoadenosine phosphosulfate reductase family protein [Nitrospirota bacterium]